ncbi:MAG TPA: hypothetical protein PLP17_16170, partial [Oligoflexia bacterium]|nr:hypothetical protein [Oligoflexia bacterium]
VFVERILQRGLRNVEAEADYQLTVEDSAAFEKCDVVVFVDASTCGTEPFEFSRLEGAKELSFTTHSIKPEGVLALAGELFGRTPDAYTLSIRGYEFNSFGEGLSPQAADNLKAALVFAEQFVQGLEKNVN